MCSLLLETYIHSSEEKSWLFQAIDTISCVKKKADWALRWIDGAESFAERLIAFACVEGIFFPGSMRGYTDFACLLYSLLKKKPSAERVKEIVKEAVDIEREFVCDALSCALVGMNGELMSQYIEFVADRLLGALRCGKVYGVGNPFDCMELVSLQGKSNFFEKRVGEYQKASVMNSSNGLGGSHVFKLDEDFKLSRFCPCWLVKLMYNPQFST